MPKGCCGGGDRSSGCGAGPLRVRLVFSTDRRGCDISVEEGREARGDSGAEGPVGRPRHQAQQRDAEAAPGGGEAGGLRICDGAAVRPCNRLQVGGRRRRRPGLHLPPQLDPEGRGAAGLR